MIRVIEPTSHNKVLEALVAGGDLAILTNRMGFDVLINPLLGVVSIQSKMRGKTWNEEELLCKATQCISCVNDALHDIETHNDDPEDDF